MENNLKPQGSQVLIKRTGKAMVDSSIIALPDSVIHYDSVTAEVIAVGPGELLETGIREEMPVKPGDICVSWAGYGEYCDTENKIMLVDMSEIDAILED